MTCTRASIGEGGQGGPVLPALTPGEQSVALTLTYPPQLFDRLVAFEVVLENSRVKRSGLPLRTWPPTQATFLATWR